MYGETFTFWNFLLDAFVIFMFIMWIWLLIVVIGDLFRRSDMGGFGKVIWIILLLILPLLGVFLYLLTQSSSMERRNREAHEEARDHLRNVVGFSVAEELAKLENLKADGKITEDEFKRLRAKLV